MPTRKSIVRCSSRAMLSTKALKRGVDAPLRQVGREIVLQLGGVVERIGFGLGLEEEVERVVDRHVGHQVDRDLELGRLLGKDQPRQVVGERVLLPVDEVLRRLDAQRIGQDRRAAMRRRPQPHHLRRQPDAAVVAVVRDVVQRDVDGQGECLRAVEKARRVAIFAPSPRREWCQQREAAAIRARKRLARATGRTARKGSLDRSRADPDARLTNGRRVGDGAASASCSAAQCAPRAQADGIGSGALA